MALRVTLVSDGGQRDFGPLPKTLPDGRLVFGQRCGICHIGPYNGCCHVRAHPMPVLHKLLRQWRLKTAEIRGLPPYIFMLEDFLPAIIQRLPRSVDELRLCTFKDSYGTSKSMVDRFLEKEGADIIMFVSVALVDTEMIPLVDMS